MGFLVSSAADVQLIDHIVLRAVLHIAQLEQIRTQRVVLPVIARPSSMAAHQLRSTGLRARCRIPYRYSASRV